MNHKKGKRLESIHRNLKRFAHTAFEAYGESKEESEKRIESHE